MEDNIGQQRNRVTTTDLGTWIVIRARSETNVCALCVPTFGHSAIQLA